MSYFSTFSAWVGSVLDECWNWFSGLHQDEWFVVLALGAALAFFCMRGFGYQNRI